jgi:Ras-related protein Rab-18
MLTINFTSVLFNLTGVEFNDKVITVQGQKVKLSIWDTAGSERFQCITPNFYRNAHGVIFVYEVNTAATYAKLDRWLRECEMHNAYPNAVKMLIGNKIDHTFREVSKSEGLGWAHRNRTLYIETSAKTSKGVSDAFTELVEKILQTENLIQGDNGGNISLSETPKNSTTGCYDFLSNTLSNWYDWALDWN